MFSFLFFSYIFSYYYSKTRFHNCLANVSDACLWVESRIMNSWHKEFTEPGFWLHNVAERNASKTVGMQPVTMIMRKALSPENVGKVEILNVGFWGASDCRVEEAGVWNAHVCLLVIPLPCVRKKVKFYDISKTINKRGRIEPQNNRKANGKICFAIMT